ncbi:MAG: N-acetylmuramoyl-L-alanine amidase family protein [Halanaerobiaceae bacterium]
MKKIIFLLIIILLFNFISFNIFLPRPVQAEESVFNRDNLVRLVKGFSALFLLERMSSSLTSDTGESEKKEKTESEQIKIEQKTEQNTEQEGKQEIEQNAEQGVKKKGTSIRNKVELPGSSLIYGGDSDSGNTDFKSKKEINDLDPDLLAGKVILIDPGHGGYDPGAVGPGGLEEKNVVLDISRKLFDVLTQNTSAQVYMTRNDDSFVSLYQRGNMANKLDVDLLISIHNNGDPTFRKKGIETFAHYNASRETWALAWYIHESLTRKLGLVDRGLQADNFQVLRQTLPRKSVLLEIGYISHLQDEQFLTRESNMQKAAEAVYRGLLKFYARN